jgi:branched-chain amino acid transport system substrate-binding protein
MLRPPRIAALVATVSVVAIASSVPAGAGGAGGAGSGGAGSGGEGGASSTSRADADTNVDGRLVVASLAPETGPLGRILDSLREPVRLAIDEINVAGGVGGEAAALVTADEGTDAATAVGAAQQLLATQGADAIIGPATSAAARAILRTVRGAALLCSGSNTAARPTELGVRRSGSLYFRTTPPDRLQGEALARLVLDDARTDVAVLASSGPDSAPVADAAVRALHAGGAKVARVRFDPSDVDLAAEVGTALRRHPDAIVVVGAVTDAARAVQALIASGNGPGVIPVYGNDGLYDPTFAELVDVSTPGVVAGITGTVPAASPPPTDAPFHALFAATGVEPFFSSYQYDCTILTALAAVKARSDDPKQMAEVFASNLKGDTDCNTFASCKELLERGKTIHYRGASSAFESFGESEPDDGIYDVYGFNPAAEAIVQGPDAQIEVPSPRQR